jgi:hypothetical protein
MRESAATTEEVNVPKFFDLAGLLPDDRHCGSYPFRIDAGRMFQLMSSTARVNVLSASDIANTGYLPSPRFDPQIHHNSRAAPEGWTRYVANYRLTGLF